MTELNSARRFQWSEVTNVIVHSHKQNRANCTPFSILILFLFHIIIISSSCNNIIIPLKFFSFVLHALLPSKIHIF